MKWFRNLSLKFKLVVLLVALTGTMLTTFGYIAIRDFEKDKIAYVLDSGLAHSRATAAQIRSDAEYAVEKVKFLLRGYDSANHAFHPYMATNFTGETRFDALVSFYRDKETGQIKTGSLLKKATLNESDLQTITRLVGKFSANADQQKPENEIAIAKPFTTSQWLLMLRFETKGAPPLFVAGLLNSANFLKVFQTSQIMNTYLVNDKNEVVIEPTTPTYNIEHATLASLLAAGQNSLKSSEGIYQFPDRNDNLLVASAATGLGGLKAVSVVPKSAALEAVRLMVMKSALFLIFLFCITVGLSILSSATLTASLKKLLNATKEIAKGNFQVNVEIKGEDEIGSLSDGFNKMTGEIKRLMLETAEKARMESELKTAQVVQASLFPRKDLVLDGLEVRGFYRPASECSGDWWYYQYIHDKVYLWIADATGHGVPAALVTSAAKSAAEIVKHFPQLQLSQIMELFTKAIYEISEGNVMMTMFMGCYDLKTHQLTYCNASHEPPVVLRNSKKPVNKNSVEILDQAIGARLGDISETRYTEGMLKLEPGDRVLFYTDGLTDIEIEPGKRLGDRRLFTMAAKQFNENKDFAESFENFKTEVDEKIKGVGLIDDCTFFMLQAS